MLLKLREFWATACSGCLQDPKRLIKYVVLVICSIVVVYQLTECFSKLFSPPIATHSYFDLNETISYPALTFCRNGPYKQDQMRRFNMSLHPKMTNNWRNFRFALNDLDAVFENITYAEDEMLSMYALDGEPNNVEVIERLFFKYGRCYTLKPRVTTRGAWKQHGYAIALHHDSVVDTFDDQPAGWHMFVHEPVEAFTEINMETSGRSEYMFVRVNEEIEVKLGAQHFNALPQRDQWCQMDAGYGFNACAERCQLRRLAQTVNCSGPWMPAEVGGWPYCRSYDSMRLLISEFLKLTSYNHTECGCAEPCRTTIYSANVMSRNKLSNSRPWSQLYLYYSSKMVTVYQEREGYDFNQFVADIGGSLGFLLGLSVLGLIVMLEQIAAWCLARFARKTGDAELAEDKEEPPNSSATSTLDIRDIKRNRQIDA